MSPEAPPDITVKASLHHQEAGGTSSERLHVPSENLIHPSLLSDPLNTFLASDIKFPVPSFREMGLRTEALRGLRVSHSRKHSQKYNFSL